MRYLLLVISILLTNIAFSQNFNKVYKSSYLIYEYGKWQTQQSLYPEGLYIILDGNEIKITNNKESKYITYGIPEKTKTDEYEYSIWNAYDKEGNSCSFIMKKFYNSDGFIMSFVYKYYAFEYITE